jgi:uncharacterized protein (TIGR02594 family)
LGFAIINIYMRVLIVLMAVGGCAAPVAELGQSLEERASGVVYAVTEPPAPEVSVMRPPPRPARTDQPTLAAAAASSPLNIAEQWVGRSEINDRQELKQFLGVDPRSTEWCAAFVNSVLNTAGQPGSESVSDHPLLARSFLDWGEPVDHKQQDPQPGDVIVFPRGRQSWQGHVGFYVDTVAVDGKEYWQILGGNQSNAVTVELYSADRAIGVRRAPEPVQEARGLLWIIRRWFA